MGNCPGAITDVGTDLLAEAFRLAGVEPTPRPDRLTLLRHMEQEFGRLPQTARNWFAVQGAVEWLVERNRDDDVVSFDRLGLPVNGLDFAAAGYLVLGTDCQGCCRWVVPLVKELPEPLFELPEQPASWHADDPPVYVVAPDDVSCTHRLRFADSFSEYAFTAVWDKQTSSLGFSHFDWDIPLRPGVLDALRDQFAPLPTTYSWAYFATCDALYRFAGPDGRVALAVHGETVVALWVDVIDQPRLRSLLALFKDGLGEARTAD